MLNFLNYFDIYVLKKIISIFNLLIKKFLFFICDAKFMIFSVTNKIGCYENNGMALMLQILFHLRTYKLKLLKTN